MTPLKREHHQAIALVLHAMDGSLLRKLGCQFGGGTAIAMLHGEYRVSVDMDFLVSDAGGYRELRLLAGSGIERLFKDRGMPFVPTREVRIDQYGIRTMLSVMGREIKLEIVREGRIALEQPGRKDELCGIPTLSSLDMASSKLLANSDRWNDDGAFNRDVIDLAMMELSKPVLAKAVAKAQEAYGSAILADLASAIDRMQKREGWLDRCMAVMSIDAPKALLWKRIRALNRILA